MRITSDGAIGLGGTNYGTSGQVLTSGGDSAVPTWSSNIAGSSGSCTGNAATATALATGRTIAMTGDVAWTSASFDGTGNVTAASVIQAGAVDIAMLSATNTASSSTFLRGDNTWQAVSGGAVSAVANGADNRIATFSSSDALNGEAGLTFDGTDLALTNQNTDINFTGAVGGTKSITVVEADDLIFKTSATERLRIDLAGQVSQPVVLFGEGPGGSVPHTINFSKSNLQRLTLTSATTSLTLATSNLSEGATVRFYVKGVEAASLLDITVPEDWTVLGDDLSSLMGYDIIIELTSWEDDDANVTAQVMSANI
jgi:hypothetical protein